MKVGRAPRTDSFASSGSDTDSDSSDTDSSAPARKTEPEQLKPRRATPCLAVVVVAIACAAIGACGYAAFGRWQTSRNGNAASLRGSSTCSLPDPADFPGCLNAELNCNFADNGTGAPWYDNAKNEDYLWLEHVDDSDETTNPTRNPQNPSETVASWVAAQTARSLKMLGSKSWAERVEESEGGERDQNQTPEPDAPYDPAADPLADAINDTVFNDRLPEFRRLGRHWYQYTLAGKVPNTGEDRTAGVWRRTSSIKELLRLRAPQGGGTYAGEDTGAGADIEDLAWEVVLDLDEVNEAEGTNWRLKKGLVASKTWVSEDSDSDSDSDPDSAQEGTGTARCRVLLPLSFGGADETEVREFDLVEKAWVLPAEEVLSGRTSAKWHGAKLAGRNGFFFPSYKQAFSTIAWKDADTVYVGHERFNTLSEGAGAGYAAPAPAADEKEDGGESESESGGKKTKGQAGAQAEDQLTAEIKEDSTTRGGYPRHVFEWRRGTAQRAAKRLFSGERSDVVVNSAVARWKRKRNNSSGTQTQFFQYDFVTRSFSTAHRRGRWWVRGFWRGGGVFEFSPDGHFFEILAPIGAKYAPHDRFVFLELSDAWTGAGTGTGTGTGSTDDELERPVLFEAGAFIAADFAALMSRQMALVQELRIPGYDAHADAGGENGRDSNGDLFPDGFTCQEESEGGEQERSRAMVAKELAKEFSLLVQGGSASAPGAQTQVTTRQNSSVRFSFTANYVLTVVLERLVPVVRAFRLPTGQGPGKGQGKDIWTPLPVPIYDSNPATSGGNPAEEYPHGVISMPKVQLLPVSHSTCYYDWAYLPPFMHDMTGSSSGGDSSRGGDDHVFLRVESAVNPPELRYVDVADLIGAPRLPHGHGAQTQIGHVLSRETALFDASNLGVEVRWTRSADGTKIPYTLIGDKGVLGSAAAILDNSSGDGDEEKAWLRAGVRNGGGDENQTQTSPQTQTQTSPAVAKTLTSRFQNPVLIKAYGSYGRLYGAPPPYQTGDGIAAFGKRGGNPWLLVYAHVRGGGEFGPEWAKAGRRENKRKSAEDVEAVARALMGERSFFPDVEDARSDSDGSDDAVLRARVTSPGAIGFRGGSAGGLLAANLAVRGLPGPAPAGLGEDARDKALAEFGFGSGQKQNVGQNPRNAKQSGSQSQSYSLRYGRDLFGAIMPECAKTDMWRSGHDQRHEFGYSLEGSSWDAFMRFYSPFHMIRDGGKMSREGADGEADAEKTKGVTSQIYPPTLFNHSTNDNRVKVGHARKFVAKMQRNHNHGEHEAPIYLMETSTGGHSGGNSGGKEYGRSWAWGIRFLEKHLVGSGRWEGEL